MREIKTALLKAHLNAIFPPLKRGKDLHSRGAIKDMIDEEAIK